MECSDMTNRRFATILAAAAFCVASTAVIAQQTPSQDHAQHHPEGAPSAASPPMSGKGDDMTSMMSSMMQAMMPGGVMMGMGDHVEGRLAFLKTELNITDAQTAQWNAFADVVRGNAKAMKEGHGMPGTKPMEMQLPAKLDRHETMLAGHLEALRKV